MNWKVLRVNARCIYSHCTMHTPAVLEQQKTWQNWNVNIKSTSNNPARFFPEHKIHKFWCYFNCFCSQSFIFVVFCCCCWNFSRQKRSRISWVLKNMVQNRNFFDDVMFFVCIFFVLLSFDSQISKIKHKTEPYMQINWTFAYEFICT